MSTNRINLIKILTPIPVAALDEYVPIIFEIVTFGSKQEIQ